MSEIKSCFISRFPEGVLLEADFSQLEIVGLAVLSGDDVLKDDIMSGRDMHRTRAAELFLIDESEVTDKQRTLAKRLSFQLQYGAGAKSMAEKNEIDIKIAKRFIENYYSRYKRVKEWQTEVAEAVKESRSPTGMHTAAGFPKGVGVYQSDTGRLYKFFEYDPPAGFYSKEPNFSPTEMKNYPVQGFATADIMALYRAKVYRRLLGDEDLFYNCLTINTVHDSIMFDCRNREAAGSLMVVLEEEAAKIPAYLASLWSIHTNLEFKIECKIGPTWAAMKKLKD